MDSDGNYPAVFTMDGSALPFDSSDPDMGTDGGWSSMGPYDDYDESQYFSNGGSHFSGERGVRTEWNGADVENYDNVDLNEPTPSMSEEFYKEVDHFLSKPAPRPMIGAVSSLEPQMKVKKSKSAAGAPKGKSSTASMKSEVSAGVSRVNNSGSGSSVYIINSHAHVAAKVDSGVGKPSSKASVTANNQKRIALNEKLLQEAFAYTEWIAKDQSLDDEIGMSAGGDLRSSQRQGRIFSDDSDLNIDSAGGMQKRNSTSAPVQKATSGAGLGSGGSGKKKGKGKSGGGLVSRLRSQTQIYAQQQSRSPGGFDTSYENSEAAISSKKLDVDALVANFEQGLTMKKLKQELEESKLSIAKSDDFMRKLSHDFNFMKR